MKYYLIKVYTCYVGEQAYHYLAIPDCDSIEDDRYQDMIADMINDNASEWWDEQSAEEFDDDYDEYLANCGCDIEEISEEEYLADS